MEYSGLSQTSELGFSAVLRSSFAWRESKPPPLVSLSAFPPCTCCSLFSVRRADDTWYGWSRHGEAAGCHGDSAGRHGDRSCLGRPVSSSGLDWWLEMITFDSSFSLGRNRVDFQTAISFPSPFSNYPFSHLWLIGYLSRRLIVLPNSL